MEFTPKQKDFIITYELRGKRFLDVVRGYDKEASKNTWMNLLIEISETFRFLSINEVGNKNVDNLRAYYS